MPSKRFRPTSPEISMYTSKIKTLDAAIEECRRLKEGGRRIVFTNGCFDILHPGHTRYLAEARRLGDALVVAINSDASVRMIKGEKRPILEQDARAELVAALACVDMVLIFDEDTPLCIIERLLPHTLVKGGDWAVDRIIGADVVTRAGGRVERIPFVGGFSTTDIIRKVLERYA
jgi:rfaE bifunctional protein nucleotidyltransferase chain/domain